MGITKFKAEIVENVLLSPIVRHLKLSLIEPSEIDFTAGQYATFIISPSTRRSYSFCSDPSLKTTFELCTDNLVGGAGSSWWNSLALQDTVEFIGPLGRFIVELDSPKHKIFIATGTGIAPVKSMILDQLKNKKDTGKIRLIFGVRNEENKLFFGEFSELAQKYSNFVFQPILSQPNGGWKGDRGRVNDLLVKIPPEELKNAKFYLCGNHQMIVGVKEQLQKLGVLAEDIHFEQFY